MEMRLENIEKSVQTLEEKISKVSYTLDMVLLACRRMDKHIEFIDLILHHLRIPRCIAREPELPV